VRRSAKITTGLPTDLIGKRTWRSPPRNPIASTR
jgi:hypothetical protein